MEVNAARILRCVRGRMTLDYAAVRLRKISGPGLFSLICIACLLLSSCPDWSAPKKTITGPAVQIVETTGDQTMLLRATMRSEEFERQNS